MNPAAKDGQSPWVWAAIGAAATVGAVVLLFSLVKSPVVSPVVAVAKPAIEFGSDLALKDRATLLDPTPLFLPTEWNAAQKTLSWPEPGGAFRSYRPKPKFTFAGAELKLELPAAVTTPARPADALTADAPGALALGFGRGVAKAEPLRRRGAFIEVVSTRNGRPVLSQESRAQIEKLAAEARPPGDQSWQPLSFLATVAPAGLVGPLVILEPRSGVEDVDNYFKDFLERTLRLGERLPPGFYRVSVGP